MENTTNINDLPIDNNPPSSMELPEQNLREPVRPDPAVYEEHEMETKKRVRFSPLPEKSGYTLQEKHKIVLLAMVFFLLFSDTKVKIYFMNILVVIFGDTLRTSGGGTSKLGLIAYTLLFGITLFAVVSAIDLSAMSL
jgi:hypothetical protein